MPVASDSYAHVPVMEEEALELLCIREDGIYVDATAGAGGHAMRVASRLGTGKLFVIDRDPDAVALARTRLAGYSCVTVLQGNYSTMDALLARVGTSAVDGILFDLGVSSMQLDNPQRGFSFQTDGPLDMRMDTTASVDAAQWLAQASRSEIIQALRDYGDVGPVGRIANKIIARRDSNRMNRTTDLVAAVTEALDFLSSMPMEVRTVFQAVRMAVNEELKHLDTGLRRAASVLAPAGRIVAITFHSGEDRVVKQIFRGWTRPEVLLSPDGRIIEKHAPVMKQVLRKPLLPSPAEISRNPRAKSAKVRAVERIPC
ncbi:MAG: 16S rRNA (cytosine(1402)-N(4))-methyltransferase RsmH [Candidatus Hydrogenedentes bacterium]|nr:16S rRNA (cytosine(1402)-N(4))-methyltransferase RsmH [Candidatus Hydrogenedentota bacterium]